MPLAPIRTARVRLTSGRPGPFSSAFCWVLTRFSTPLSNTVQLSRTSTFRKSQWRDRLASGHRILDASGQEQTQAECDELTSKLTFVPTESCAARSSGPCEAGHAPFLVSNDLHNVEGSFGPVRIDARV
jgi:hypothetical protein